MDSPLAPIPSQTAVAAKGRSWDRNLRTEIGYEVPLPHSPP